MKVLCLSVMTCTIFAACSSKNFPNSNSTQHISFERTSTGYSAFPDLYFDVKGRLILEYINRTYSSHYNSTGIHFTFSSNDCGSSWFKEAVQHHPAKFYNTRTKAYEWIAPNGWKRTKDVAEVPSNSLTRIEGGWIYYSRGLSFHMAQPEQGIHRTIPIETPPHSVMMGLNSVSHLLTSKGTYLTTFYLRKSARSPHQAYIARRPAGGAGTSPAIIELTNELGNKGDETALIESTDGEILAFTRPFPDRSNHLLISKSDDDGITWTPPQPSMITGFPASAHISGEHVVITTANRYESPMSVNAFIIDPKTLNVTKTRKIAEFVGGKVYDFGYPVTVSCGGQNLTAYYAPHPDGGAEVIVTTWQ